MADMPETCKAAVLVEFGKPLEIRKMPIPDVEPDGILVKNEIASVCGTDIHQWHGKGRAAPLPLVPGHEAVGRVLSLGAGRTSDCSGESIKVGDRIMWSHVNCNDCYACNITRQRTLCKDRFSYGYNYSITGAFSEYEYLIPNTEVVKIPEELSNEEVVGASCALRTAVAAFERLNGIGIDSNVVVQGAGPVGLYCTMLSNLSGAKQTIVVGAPAKRLDLAKEMGASHTIDIEEIPDNSERIKRINDLTDGRGPDIVIEASGAPIAFAEGIEMIRRGGRYLVIGQTSPDKISISPGMVVLKHLEIIGQCGAEISHYYKALQIIKNNREKYPFGKIISNKYSLDQINEAYAAMEAGKEIKPAILP